MNWYFKNQSGEEFGPFDSQLEAVEESFRYDFFGFRMERNEEGVMEALTTTSSIGNNLFDGRYRAIRILSVASSNPDDEQAMQEVAAQLCEAYPFEMHSNYSHEVYKK